MKLPFIAFIFAVSLPVHSQVDWNEEYKTLCSYDRKWCDRLKNSDGTWVKPKPEIVKLMKELAPTIKEVAAKVGVSSMAIAGAIMAENSLNVSVSDNVQDLLVRMGVADKGEILGKKFTFGLGQLNFSAAREGDNYLAKLESRKPLSDKELTDALLVPSKAIYYVGAVLRKVQDDYKQNGIDISDKPEILTTLYNLGLSESRAASAKANKTTPRFNYFGFFVKKNAGALAFLNTPLVPKSVAIISPKGPSKVIAQSSAQAAVVPLIPKVLTPAFSKSVALYAAPPACNIDSGYGAMNLQSKYNSMKNFPVTAIVNKGVGFKTLAPSIDCESNNWKLVEANNGDVGWIKEDDLNSSSTKIMLPVDKCKSSLEVQKCAESVKKSTSGSLLEDTDKGMLYLKPFSKSPIVNFKKPDWFCTESQKTDSSTQSTPIVQPYLGGGGLSTGLAGGMGAGSQYNQQVYESPFHKDTHPVLAGFLSFITPSIKREKEDNPVDKVKELSSLLKLKIKQIEDSSKMSINDLKHPYRGIMIGNLSSTIQGCIEKQETKLSPCSLDLQKIKSIISELPIKDKLDVNDYGYLNYNILNAATLAPFVNKDDYLKDKSKMGYYMNGYLGGGYGFGKIKAQYLLSEGEEESWSLADVQATIKSCDENIEVIREELKNSPLVKSAELSNMEFGLDSMKGNTFHPALELLEVIKKQETINEKETWRVMRPRFVSLIKLCVALNDTYDTKLKDLPGRAQEQLCSYSELEALESSMGEVATKELMKALSMSSLGMGEFSNQAPDILSNHVITGAMNFFVFTQNAPPSQQVNAIVERVETESYCPNKTAEMIEEMMEANPCIKRVYVSEDWLVNRLNGLGKKIVKRPFEKTDRFAVDVGELECK